MPKRPNTQSRTDRGGDVDRTDSTGGTGRTAAGEQPEHADRGVEPRPARSRRGAPGTEKPASEREAFDRWREDQDLGRDEE